MREQRRRAASVARLARAPIGTDVRDLLPAARAAPTRPGREAPVGAISPAAARLARLRGPGGVDLPLLLAVAALLVIGLVMVFSASQLDVPGDPSYWLRKQALWAAIGMVVLAGGAALDYHRWRRLAFPAMLLALGLGVLVLRRGAMVYGGQRWLRLGITFQPSEVIKLAVALYLADWLVRKGEEVRSVVYGLLPFAALVGLVLLLILLENDLGTSIVVLLLALSLFFVAGADPRAILGALAVAGAGALALAAGSSFRRARLLAFLHPLPPGCAAATSYQLCQGLVSLGSGGVFGLGLGESVQKAGYLPNPFTDSIFAVLGEELGLLGGAVVLALFAVVAWRGYRIARRAPDAYGALLAYGLTTWITLQAVVNVGSVADVIPFTGVPLPFISYGGSSLVVTLAAVGLLLSVSRRGDPRPGAEEDAFAS